MPYTWTQISAGDYPRIFRCICTSAIDQYRLVPWIQSKALALTDIYSRETCFGRRIIVWRKSRGPYKDSDNYGNSRGNQKWLSLFAENQIQYENNTNIEDKLKQQSNQSNTDLNIDEILKNSELKPNEQINDDNNLNLDSLFNQQRDSQIDDDLINKIFEYSEQRNKNNPMYQSQQIKPSQINNILSGNSGNNKFYSTNNTPQRSGILNSVSAKI